MSAVGSGWVVALGVVVFLAFVASTVHDIRTRDKSRYSALAAWQHPSPLSVVLIVALVVLAFFVC
jgi:hypothetical protein